MNKHIDSFVFFLVIESLMTCEKNLRTAKAKGEKEIDKGGCHSDKDKADDEPHQTNTCNGNSPTYIPAVEYQKLQRTL